jgi:hypothetical protein
VNNLNDHEPENETPGCTNPTDYHQTTAFLDSAASISLVGQKALCKIAEVQERNKTLGIPNGASMETTQTVELLLTKFPKAARKAYRVPKITNNLVAVSELCDAGCTVFFHKHGVDIEYEGEVIGRGWRDKTTRLWRVPLCSEGGERITPHTSPEEYDPTSGIVFQAEINSIYECENKEQITKYFHASLGSHPKATLIEAANSNYLRGCPGLDATAIRKFIAVEDATEMGHMKQSQQGVRSTTTKSNRGRPAKLIQEREEAHQDAISVPKQSPNNEKTNLVFMTTQKAEGFVASDQTGMLPRTSNRGMKYLCIFLFVRSKFHKRCTNQKPKKGGATQGLQRGLQILRAARVQTQAPQTG